MVVRIPEVLWMTIIFNKDPNALATLCYLPQESLLLLILQNYSDGSANHH